MSNEKQNGFLATPVLSAIFSFIMSNLELIALSFALQVWFNAGDRWEYWVTILLVAICSGISTAYNNNC